MEQISNINTLLYLKIEFGMIFIIRGEKFIQINAINHININSKIKKLDKDIKNNKNKNKKLFII